MMLNFRRSKQSGISLLEVLLSLSVIAIILVMATRYYKSAQQSQQASNALSILSGIVTAETQYAAANGNQYATGTINKDHPLVKNGYLPSNFGTDPWGGTITIGTVSAGGYSITLSGPIPTQTCSILAGMVNSGSGSASCNGTSLVANYQ